MLAQHVPKLLNRAVQVALYPESTVSVTAAGDAPASWSGDLLVVGIFEDDLDTSGGPLHALSSVGGVCMHLTSG